MREERGPKRVPQEISAVIARKRDHRVSVCYIGSFALEVVALFQKE